MGDAVKQFTDGQPVVLIGYSGGAMLSGLIIEHTPGINIRQWVTVAGVLNHTDWTEYFDDTPLMQSMDMNALPAVSQIHYVATHDTVVPRKLSEKWLGDKMHIVPESTHNQFDNLTIDFL